MKGFFLFSESERDNLVATKAAITSAGLRVLDVGAGMGHYRPLFSHCEYRAHDFGREPSTIDIYT